MLTSLLTPTRSSLSTPSPKKKISVADGLHYLEAKLSGHTVCMFMGIVCHFVWSSAWTDFEHEYGNIKKYLFLVLNLANMFEHFISNIVKSMSQWHGFQNTREYSLNTLASFTITYYFFIYIYLYLICIYVLFWVGGGMLMSHNFFFCVRHRRPHFRFKQLSC